MTYIQNPDGTWSQQITSTEKISKDEITQQISNLQAELLGLPERLEYPKDAKDELKEAVDIWNRMFVDDPKGGMEAEIKTKQDLLKELV